MARKISWRPVLTESGWRNVDIVTAAAYEAYIRAYDDDSPLMFNAWYLDPRRKSVASNMVKLPDGSEQNASEMICEGCEQPMSEHSCGGSVTITTGSAGTGRSTGPRKAPATRPECPHCGGAVHFSMPGGLQNVECAMRQWYKDTGVIADPYARLPIYGLTDVASMLDWNQSLATPITYGRMESAAGGAGTYASLRPKADPKPAGSRAKKRKAAEKGERIEDLAGAVTADDFEDLGGPAVFMNPDDGVTTKAKGKRKSKVKLTEAVVGEDFSAGTIDREDTVEEPTIDLEAERLRKREERRRILAGSR